MKQSDVIGSGAGDGEAIVQTELGRVADDSTEHPSNVAGLSADTLGDVDIAYADHLKQAVNQIAGCRKILGRRSLVTSLAAQSDSNRLCCGQTGDGGGEDPAPRAVHECQQPIRCRG